MGTFRKYISKYLASFVGLVLLLLCINIAAFGLTFYGVVTKDYGGASPQKILEATAVSASLEGISNEASERLRSNHIWAVYLDLYGNTAWKVDAPRNIPEYFTIQDVAVFAKGYLADYPVFIRNTDDGMLILGYPQDSYMKLSSNYLTQRSIATLPFLSWGYWLPISPSYFWPTTFQNEKFSEVPSRLSHLLKHCQTERKYPSLLRESCRKLRTVSIKPPVY